MKYGSLYVGDCETLRRIFDRFFRREPAHSGTVKGCGLGLSVGQWIVYPHNGTIKMDSIPSQPTTINILLSLVQENQTA